MFQERFMDVSRRIEQCFKGIFKDVSLKFKGCRKKVLKGGLTVFQEKVKEL